jgi:Protein of unknown function (DUF2924)
MAMSSRQHAVSREALARLPSLNLGELRQQWRGLYKAAAPAHFSRELLMRAVAYRLQELAFGGLRLEAQRRLRQIARELNETGAARIGLRPALKPGSRLTASGRAQPMRCWCSMMASHGRVRTTARCPSSHEQSPARRGRGRCSSG